MYKIDSYYSNNVVATTMKPIYLSNKELDCGVIHFKDKNKTYLVDSSDKDRIINFSKTFVFVNDTDLYPSYSYNYKRFNYLDFIFCENQDSVYYVFKNGNNMDLRRSNVEINHFYHKVVSEKYDILEFIRGHNMHLGQDANIMKNPLWRVSKNDKEYLLM